jgi:hypothetical protein
VSCLQTILFTTDDTILELISQYDESFCSLFSETGQDDENCHVERPITAHNGVSTQCSFNGEGSWIIFNFLQELLNPILNSCHRMLYLSILLH